MRERYTVGQVGDHLEKGQGEKSRDLLTKLMVTKQSEKGIKYKLFISKNPLSALVFLTTPFSDGLL